MRGGSATSRRRARPAPRRRPCGRRGEADRAGDGRDFFGRARRMFARDRHGDHLARQALEMRAETPPCPWSKACRRSGSAAATPLLEIGHRFGEHRPPASLWAPSSQISAPGGRARRPAARALQPLQPRRPLRLGEPALERRDARDPARLARNVAIAVAALPNWWRPGKARPRQVEQAVIILEHQPPVLVADRDSRARRAASARRRGSLRAR